MPVEVSGATGAAADLINGTYTSTEERLNGKIMYSKLGDASKCLYLATDKTWCVAQTEAVQAGKIASVAVTEVGLPHAMLATHWRVWDRKEWSPQPLMATVMVSSVMMHLTTHIK